MKDLLADTSSQSAALDAIGRAVFAALNRDQAARLITAALAIALVVATIVRWTWQERKRREAAASTGVSPAPQPLSDVLAEENDGRQWVRVFARAPMVVQHKDPKHGFYYEDCETETISAGEVTFFTRSPPSFGSTIQFSLKLDERWPLQLHGRVAGVDPPGQEGKWHVVVKLGLVTPSERERLVQWTIREQVRETADAHRLEAETGHSEVAASPPSRDHG